MNRQKSIYLSVTNDIQNDQRLERMVQVLRHENHHITIIGRKKGKVNAINEPGVNRKLLRTLITKGPLFYALFNLKLFFFLISKKIDLLIAIDLDTLVANYLIKKIKSCDLLYDSHELFTEVPELVNRPMVKKIWRKIEAAILPKLSEMICVSDSIAHYYQNTYKIKAHVIRNLPGQIQQEKHNKSLSEGYFIYQGALNKGRGIHLMIEVMEYLDNFSLFIAGDGDEKEELVRFAKSKPWQHRVHFIGKVSPTKLKDYTKNALIGFSFEEDLGLSYKYCLPNKLFDYIHAEIPALVSDLPEMKKIIQNHPVGEILRQRNPKTIALQIKSMLEKYQHYTFKNAKEELNWENERILLKKILSSYLNF